MRGSLLKVAITGFLSILMHFLSFGQNYIIHEGDWIEIADADDLRRIGIGFPLNGKYLQTQDIDLSDFSENGGWPGIGADNKHFVGVFNGQGFTIRNLTIDRDGFDQANGHGLNQGLFAYVGLNAVLKNIRLTNVLIRGGEKGVYVGALVGRNSGHIINSAAINGTLDAFSHSGGLVGSNRQSGKIERSYSGIDVSGTSQMGGLVGVNMDNGLIINSYSQGIVSGEVDIGGLVGVNYQNKSAISNSYSSGFVNYKQNGGGLIGNNTGIVEDSYWNIEASQQLNSSGSEVGKSDIEMKVKSTFAGWNFDDIWDITEGESMPFLKSLGEFVNKEIPELSFLINGNPIQIHENIECTYGDRLTFIPQSTSDGSLSELELEISDPTVIDISNFPEVRAINTGEAILKIIQPETENYESIKVYLLIRVGQKELRITPDIGQQKVYGEEEPVHLEFAVDNLEDVDIGLLSGGFARAQGEDVGDYVIQGNDFTAGDNYIIHIDTNIVFFKIIPREILIEIDEKEKIFGDLDPLLTFQLLKGNLIEGDAFEGSLQREDGENAGRYYISRGNLTAGSNYLLTFNEDNNFIIKRASSEITAEENQVYVYDGTPKNIIASINHEEAKISYAPDSSFVEAGSYQVQIYSPQTANYLESNKEVTIIIHKAIQEGIILEDREYVYNGEKRSLVVSGLTPEMEKDIEITYTNNGHGDAGDYDVTATVKRPNFDDLTLKAKLTIHKAETEITAEANQVYVYDGTPKNVVASINHEEATISYSPDSIFVKAGSYHVEIHSPQTMNYLEANKEVTLTIHKAIQEGIYLEEREYTYNGEERSLLIAGLTHDTEITYINNGHSNAGIYDVTAIVKRPSYEDLTLEARLIIHKAKTEITAEEDQVYVYDGTPKNLIASVNHDEAIISYSPDSSFVEAGEYQVQIHSPQTMNYLESNKEVTITIHKAIQEGIYLEDSEYVYNGEKRSLIVSVLTPEIENDIEITYTNNGHVDAGIYEVTAIVQRLNYEDLTLKARLTIHKAKTEITAEEDQVYVYDGAPKNVVASLNHEEATISYFPDSSFVEAGSYQIQIHSPQTMNYLESNKEITITIHKAIREGIYLEDREYIYNGEERSLLIAGLTHDVENGTEITYINNGHSNAGIYDVTAIVQRPNYEDITLKAKLTIHKAETEIIAEPNQIHIYDGTPKAVIANINHQESKLFYEPIAAIKNAGAYEIKVYSEESRNFLKGSKMVILTIEKSIVTVSVVNVTKKFGENNPEFIVNYKGFRNGENVNVLTKAATVNTLAATISGIGEYIISPSGALAENYDFEYIDGILTITPTDFGNITFENKNFVYNGKEHSLSLSNLPKDVSLVYKNNNHINAGNYLVKATISKPGYLNRTLEAELTIEKAPQVIHFEEVGKVSRSQPYVELKARSNVGLPIELFSDDDLVASLNGHTLLIHRLGTVRVTASQNGDKNHEAAEPITILVQVEDKKQGSVRVHQALSPNGDGINDFLIVEGIKEFSENRLQIITPSGMVVFDLEGYDNEVNVFRGVSNRSSLFGSLLPDGTYFYMLRYKKDSQWESEKGWIYLKTQ